MYALNIPTAKTSFDIGTGSGSRSKEYNVIEERDGKRFSDDIETGTFGKPAEDNWRMRELSAGSDSSSKTLAMFSPVCCVFSTPLGQY